MGKLLFGLILFAIFVEVVVIVCKKYAYTLRYTLLAACIPILFCAIYNLRFLLYGVEGMKNYIQGNHTSTWLFVLALTMATINYLTYSIISNGFNKN